MFLKVVVVPIDPQRLGLVLQSRGVSFVAAMPVGKTVQVGQVLWWTVALPVEDDTHAHKFIVAAAFATPGSPGLESPQTKLIVLVGIAFSFAMVIRTVI